MKRREISRCLQSIKVGIWIIQGGGSLGYYKALGGSGKSGGDTFHNLPPPPPHPHLGQLGLFGMLSFSHKLKIIVEVAYSQNLTIGKCAVFEIYAIEVLFRKTNLAAK